MTPSASPPIRVIVAGAGAFGREHLDRLMARSDVEVVGVADRDPVALARAQQRHGAALCLADATQVMDRTKPDAIVVATPSSSHVTLAIDALERGVCVLLEKPVATSASAAEQLIRAAAKSTAFVLPGHVLRFSSDHARLVEIVRSGKIGNVVYVNSRRYRDDAHAVRYQDTDPVLMTLIHDIDLARWIAKSPFRSVRAWRSRGAGFRSMTATIAITKSGVCCELRTAWLFKAGDLPSDRLEVVGDLGSVELDVGRTLRLYADGREAVIPLAAGDDPLANEHDHFLACLRDRQLIPALTLTDAIAGLKLADAMLNSLRLEKDVVVEE